MTNTELTYDQAIAAARKWAESRQITSMYAKEVVSLLGRLGNRNYIINEELTLKIMAGGLKRGGWTGKEARESKAAINARIRVLKAERK